jgi:hypothetical protein
MIEDRIRNLSRMNVLRMILLVALAIAVCITAYLVWQDWRPETKSRLTNAAMEQLVEDPIAVAREGGLAAGEEAFERLRERTERQYGSGSVQVADLREAFGVELYVAWEEMDDRAFLAASREHLRAAVPAYRRAFGADDPEVAVALHTFADVEIKLHDGPTPEAEAALREALRIRRDSLGWWNRETRATEERLESLRDDDRSSHGTVRMPQHDKKRDRAGLPGT